MTKVLLVIGDSWAAGAELKPGEVPYADILEKRLGFDRQYRYSRGGAANEHSLEWLQQYLREEHQPDWDVTAIFHLTNPERTSILPWGANLEIHANDKKSWNSAAREYWMEWYLHFFNKDYTKLRATTTVTALQTWCKVHNIKDYYFAGWIHYNNILLPGVDMSKIWAQGTETAGDWFGAKEFQDEFLVNVGNNLYIQPNISHPNQLGHELIADKLAGWISQSQ